MRVCIQVQLIQALIHCMPCHLQNCGNWCDSLRLRAASITAKTRQVHKTHTRTLLDHSIRSCINSSLRRDLSIISHCKLLAGSILLGWPWRVDDLPNFFAFGGGNVPASFQWPHEMERLYFHLSFMSCVYRTISYTLKPYNIMEMFWLHCTNSGSLQPC